MNYNVRVVTADKTEFPFVQFWKRLQKFIEYCNYFAISYLLSDIRCM